MKILISISDRRYQSLIKMKDSGAALSYCEEAIVSGTVVPDNCEVQPKVSDLHAKILYCKDATDRQAVDNIFQSIRGSGEDTTIAIYEHILDLPSVQPKSRPVKWIEHFNEDEYEYECDRCHEWSDCQFDYCPNCGAKMEEG